MWNVLGGLDATAEHVWPMRRCAEPWQYRPDRVTAVEEAVPNAACGGLTVRSGGPHEDARRAAKALLEIR